MFVPRQPGVAITLLVLLMAFRSPSLNYETLMRAVVFSAACAVAFRTAKDGRYQVAAAFTGIALLFNPLVPVVLSPAVFPWVGLASVLMFLRALGLVAARERMPIASIADGIKKSESVEAVWAWKR
ncbi:MAG TPA: DUF6804 family protein [Candidatus Angelobacter sp.]|nr:DUF6804 family protein [Candidatus Angelobacter sp.]